ncbi:hypothetical protein JZ751_001408 [Albula glossodonta]|uniref:Uncharacterized protein n=1 Tax=Albula glossodonta TaxID=121402 RepID=A0A8T2PTK4_9TELE|nr:hypothetical protein JZ751_001408 [Albula glossodonta]
MSRADNLHDRAGFGPSTHWTSRVRSSGQLEVQSAETATHEHPDSSSTLSPVEGGMLRSRDMGCLRMMPLSMSGVMDLQRFRSILVHSLLSQHLRRRGQKQADTITTQ